MQPTEISWISAMPHRPCSVPPSLHPPNRRLSPPLERLFCISNASVQKPDQIQNAPQEGCRPQGEHLLGPLRPRWYVLLLSQIRFCVMGIQSERKLLTSLFYRRARFRRCSYLRLFQRYLRPHHRSQVRPTTKLPRYTNFGAVVLVWRSCRRLTIAQWTRDHHPCHWWHEGQGRS